MFIGTYYPAMEQADEFCFREPDMVGTGTASCGETTACVLSCPPGSEPAFIAEGFFTGLPEVSECWQRCITASCPEAFALFFAQGACRRERCAAACADSSSPDCSTCLLSECLDVITACSDAVCR